MPNIKPVSALRNYNKVLEECEAGNPVLLTKKKRGKYVIIDIKEYEKQQAMFKLMSKLVESEDAVKDEEKWLDFSDLKHVLED